MTRLHELQEKRASLVTEMRALADKADMSENEQSRFDALKGELRSLETKITNAQTVAAFERHADATPLDGEHGIHTDLSRYSLAKAIRSNGRPDGLEGEVHAELSRGREVRGVMVPTEILLGGAEHRTGQEVGNDLKGGLLVPTDIRPVADRPRPLLKVEAMGATVLRGLVGLVDLPNLDSSGSTYWIGENQNTTRSEAAFNAVHLNPRTVSAEYKLTRQIINQANQSIESLLRRDLGLRIAQAVDASAIKNRSGGNAEPEGLLGSGIEKVTTETLLTDTVANLIEQLEIDDYSGTRALLTNPQVMAIARKLKDGESRPIPFATTFHGERVEVTTQVPTTLGVSSNKSGLIAGIWSELYVGYWSAVDVLANPYHSDVASQGGLLLHAFLDVDVAESAVQR